jgi:6-phosphogluconolactonase (cycloisomerase 2 family)
MRFPSRAAICVPLALAALAVAAAPAAAAGGGAVFTSTNSGSGNSVVAFHRAGDGSLTPAGSFATGGNGTGGGLGNQGALALGTGGRFLYVVNAGSDSVSAFAVHGGGLDLLGITPSGGDQPISVTVHRDLLYVLDAGSGTIVGFTGARHGRLRPLSGSTQAITGSGPAEVKFSTGGKVLVVTDKDTNTIDTFAVRADGRPRPARSHPSEGETPFGFDFDKRGHLIVSEAFGGAPGASALSSYSVAPAGALDTISPSIPDHETAACWVEVTKNGRFAYTTNTGSGSISSYAVAHDGSLGLVERIAADTGVGSAPTDLAQSRSGRVLVALLPGSDSVATYRVGSGGELGLVDQAGGIPASATGLASH